CRIRLSIDRPSRWILVFSLRPWSSHNSKSVEHSCCKRAEFVEGLYPQCTPRRGHFWRALAPIPSNNGDHRDATPSKSIPKGTLKDAAGHFARRALTMRDNACLASLPAVFLSILPLQL